MKIGYILSRDPFTNRRYWSGTAYKTREAIERAGFEVVHISAKVGFMPKVYHILLKIFATITGHNSYSFYTRVLAKHFARVVSKNMIDDVDLLFVPAYTSYFAYLETSKPIVFYTDSSFRLNTSNYYKYLSNLLPFNRRQGEQIEQRAFDKCELILCASEWARQSIINDYSQAPSKVHVIELGANIDEKDIRPSTDVTARPNPLNLLFLAVEWERKGGDTAVQSCMLLNSMGIPAKLHIVGITPPVKTDDRYIEVHGYLNKNIAEEYQRLCAVIASSDLLLLPTSAEAAGVVFGEASGYGIPSFTYDTGGIPNYVINGLNGYRLPLGSTPHDFACRIKECLESGELIHLKKGCRDHYLNRLNWHVWSDSFAKQIKNLSLIKK